VIRKHVLLFFFFPPHGLSLGPILRTRRPGSSSCRFVAHARGMERDRWDRSVDDARLEALPVRGIGSAGIVTNSPWQDRRARHRPCPPARHHRFSGRFSIGVPATFQNPVAWLRAQTACTGTPGRLVRGLQRMAQGEERTPWCSIDAVQDFGGPRRRWTPMLILVPSPSATKTGTAA